MRDLFIAKRLLRQLSGNGITGYLDNNTLTLTDDSIGFRRTINLSDLTATESQSYQSELVYYCARDLIREHRQMAIDRAELNDLIGL